MLQKTLRLLAALAVPGGMAPEGRAQFPAGGSVPDMILKPAAQWQAVVRRGQPQKAKVLL
jgi:hypothetical protein